MRGHQRVGRMKQRMIQRQRGFRLKNVNARASQLAAVQSVRQGLRIDHRTTGQVKQQRAILHLRKGLGANQAAGRGVKRAVKRYDIRIGQQPGKGHALDSVQLPALMRRAGTDDPAPKGLAKARGCSSDFPQPNNADGLSLQLAPHQAGLVAARAAARLYLRHVAQKGKHHFDGQFRNRLIGISAGVAHHGPGCLGRRQVHMVHAGKRNINKPQMTASAQRCARHGHVGQNHHVRIADFIAQSRNIGGLCISGEGMSRRREGRGVLVQQRLRNAQAFG